LQPAAPPIVLSALWSRRDGRIRPSDPAKCGALSTAATPLGWQPQSRRDGPLSHRPPHLQSYV